MNKKMYTLIMISVITMFLFFVGCTNKENLSKDIKQNLTNELVENGQKDKDTEIKYSEINSFEYIHIISFNKFEDSKRDFKKTIYFEDIFEGFIFSGNLDVFKGEVIKDKNGKKRYDLYYKGVLYKIKV